MKNVIYRNLEKKLTDSHLGNLDAFVKTINSNVNGTIKLAPNKVTKKDVPRFLSFSGKIAVPQKSKLLLVILCAFSKKRTRSGMATDSRLLTRFFEIASIPTWLPPSYSPIDADKEFIQSKFYQP